MTALSIATAAFLATQCAPAVAPGTLLSIARTESGLSPFAIHDNTANQTYFPVSSKEAELAARGLISLGHSVDAGLMQINSENFSRLGVDSKNAFDPCTSMRAGAVLLTAAYQQCRTGSGDAQGCIRQAASVYNTGTTFRGFYNGYVHKVELSADVIVPEIHAAAPIAPAPVSDPAPVPQCPPASKPEDWHVAEDPACAPPVETTWHVQSTTTEGVHE